MEKFKVIIVEDVQLELKGTEGIFRQEIPEAEIIGTAQNEKEFWALMETEEPDLVLLDLGLCGSTTAGVEICRKLKVAAKQRREQVAGSREQGDGPKVLIFTGETSDERLWVDVLAAGADGIILKCGELLTKGDVMQVMSGKRMVFNQPILEKILGRFSRAVRAEFRQQDAEIEYGVDEYDERLLRHLALGYTKDMIAKLKGMPFGVKSLEKRQNDLVMRLFGESARNVNVVRLVTKAIQEGLIDINNLYPDEE